MTRLVQNLREVVRKLAYSTSVDQLKKQGINKVNVLGIDRIALLIQESVKKSLRYKLLAMDREEIANATKDEFLRLLKSNKTLERQQSELKNLKDAAEAQVDELRRELAEQQRLLAARLDTARSQMDQDYLAEDRDLADRVRAVIHGLIDAGRPQEIPDRVLEIVMAALSEERRRSMVAREAIRDREVVNLQRRIEKLSSSLGQTESRLAEVAAIKNLDPGISSVYREVQGLGQADRQFRAKSALMESIFEANLLLQGK